MSGGFDPVGVLEAAYRLEDDNGSWLRRVGRAAAPAIPAGIALLAYTYRLGEVFEIQDPQVVSGKADFQELVRRVVPRFHMDDLERFFFHRHVSSISECFKRPMPAESVDAGVEDFYAVHATDADGTGVLVGRALRRPRSPAPDQEAVWSRVGAHVVAGFRLRRRLQRLRSGSEGLVDAVLTPDGRCRHAKGAAEPRSARERLRAAVQCRMRALRIRKKNPTRALELWQGLIGGTWTLVDRFESDGRRVFVAYRNQVPAHHLIGLPRRQREVVRLAVLGHGNKQIAYTLGISQSSVATHLQSACRRLRVDSVGELMHLASAFERNGSRAELAPGLEVVSPPPVSSFCDLTTAQHEVAELVARGLSNAEIARLRGTSPRTVANQVASILDRLQLGSRRELARYTAVAKPR